MQTLTQYDIPELQLVQFFLARSSYAPPTPYCSSGLAVVPEKHVAIGMVLSAALVF